MSAQFRLVINQENSNRFISHFQGCCQSGWTAADDGDITMLVDMLAVITGSLLYVNLTQPGGPSQKRFSQMPEAGINHGLVIKAWGQKAVQFVRDRQEIRLQRWPSVLVPDFIPVLDRLSADPHVGTAIDVHQAVGTFSIHAKESTRPVILKAATENANPSRIQGRSDGIARKGWHCLLVKTECDFPVRVDDLGFYGR